MKLLVLVALALVVAVSAQGSSGGVFPPPDDGSSGGVWPPPDDSSTGFNYGQPCVHNETYSIYGNGFEPCAPCTRCGFNDTTYYYYCTQFNDALCDRNECEIYPGICGSDPNAYCYNYYGSYSCQCQYGYVGSPPNTSCEVDINLCNAVPDICSHFNGTISNSTYNPGSYCSHYQGTTYCGCAYPYIGGGIYPIQTPCRLVNACQENDNYGNNYCAERGAYCYNYDWYIGAWSCQCNYPSYWGWQNGTYQCLTDYNECADWQVYNSTLNGLCGYDPNAYCVNTPGSYYCTCFGGYQGNPPSQTCQAIDYCTYYPPQWLCPDGWTCVSIPQSWQCIPPAPQTDCGVLLDDGNCQVGYLNPPACCHRISDFHPLATAQAVGTDVVITISNTGFLPYNYQFIHGLTPTTQGDLFAPYCTFYATVQPGNSSTQYSYAVPFTSLGNCLAPSVQGDRLSFQGFVGMSLSYIPWGNAAHVGLWFFYIHVDILNSTQVVSLLSVTPESFENAIDLEIHPQASIMHCTDANCNAVDVTYFARVGDTEYFKITVDAGSATGTATLSALILEDLNHHPVAIVNPTIIAHSGFTLVLSFVVPGGYGNSVKFVRAMLSVDFLAGFSSDLQPFAAPQNQLVLSSSRFEILPAEEQDSSAATAVVAFTTLCVTVFMAFKNVQ